MKKIQFILIAFLMALIVTPTWAQDEEEAEVKKKPRPERAAFESPTLIDNQTDVINGSKTLEWNIQHRFGQASNGTSDLFGMFAASNIRLGFTYSLMDRLSIGFGLAKVVVTQPYIDLNVKYKILEQKRKGGFPVNVTYFANTVIDSRDKANFEEGSHRFSFFHEIIVSRRFSKALSLQVAGMMGHFNAVDTWYANDIFGISVAGRYKFTPQSSLMIEYTQPLNEHAINDEVYAPFNKDVGPYPNIALGWEIKTSSHAFQIFISTYRDLLPQYNLNYNTNKFIKETEDGNKPGFMIGFNMTRLWGF